MSAGFSAHTADWQPLIDWDMKMGAGFLVSQRGISWKALTVSVLTLSFLTLTCFSVVRLHMARKQSRHLNYRRSAKLKYSSHIPVCVTCPHLMICGFPCMAFGKVCAATGRYFAKRVLPASCGV